MERKNQEARSEPLWGACQQAIALATLAVCSPLLLGIATAIKADSRGPVIFRQDRPGWKGGTFTALKFRTMRTGTEAATSLGVSVTDFRITRIGRFLRATKIDELPQLWNIAKGDMRFVGPRPIPKSLDAALRAGIPGFEQRYEVKPGLTSLAQVCISDNSLGDRMIPDWSQRFEAERRYIRNKSIAYDIAVVFLTGLYVLRKAVKR